MTHPKPDWRDPNMPVLIPCYQPDGTIKLESFSPIDVQLWMEDLHNRNAEPDWRNDPTYNLRKSKP